MSEWRFIRHKDDTWSWMSVATDHVSGSFRHFRSIAEAIRDAGRHGYEDEPASILNVQPERRSKPRRAMRAGAS